MIHSFISKPRSGRSEYWRDRERRDTEETLPMTMIPITLHVDPESAKAFESASDEERNKI